MNLSPTEIPWYPSEAKGGCGREKSYESVLAISLYASLDLPASVCAHSREQYIDEWNGVEGGVVLGGGDGSSVDAADAFSVVFERVRGRSFATLLFAATAARRFIEEGLRRIAGRVTFPLALRVVFVPSAFLT